MLQLKPGTSWADVYARAPHGFDADRISNLTGGEWKAIGHPART